MSQEESGTNAVKLNPHFQDPAADVVLRSKDGYLFRVSSWHLSQISGMFCGLFDMASPASSPQRSSEPIDIHHLSGYLLGVFLDYAQHSCSKEYRKRDRPFVRLTFNQKLQMYAFVHWCDCDLGLRYLVAEFKCDLQPKGASPAHQTLLDEHSVALALKASSLDDITLFKFCIKQVGVRFQRNDRLPLLRKVSEAVKTDWKALMFDEVLKVTDAQRATPVLSPGLSSAKDSAVPSPRPW